MNNKADLKEQNICMANIAKIEEIPLEESQLAEQLYNNAGLGPVVEAGLKDYDKQLHQEDKLLNKVFGARAADIRSYGEAVAKRVALAVYALMNRDYGGKVGNLRSYIMTLQEERDRANLRYDELMGRVVGILGEEYRDLSIDSKELLKRLGDIECLRSKIETLEEEKIRLKVEHDCEVACLELEKMTLANSLESLTKRHEELKEAMRTLAGTIPDEELGKKLSDELYRYILEDSRVPDIVIGGVGKFIDFKKYLAVAADRGAKEVCKRIEGTLAPTRPCASASYEPM